MPNFFFVFHALSFEVKLFFDRSFPLMGMCQLDWIWHHLLFQGEILILYTHPEAHNMVSILEGL